MNDQLIALLIRTIAAAAVLNAEIEAMKTTNQERLSRGQTIAYTESVFYEVIRKSGLGCNDVQMEINRIIQ